VTEEWLFQGWKICYKDFGSERSAGPSKCGHSGEGRCILGDRVTDAGRGDAKGD
jgi:hypothetical protein